MLIKAISLHQPYADFIIQGHKRFETRSWSASHRGLVAMHAARKWDDETKHNANTIHRMFPAIPLIEKPALGAMIGICRLLDCVPTESLIKNISAHERAVGGWGEGRFAWEMEVLELFESPIEAKGQQGLFDWEFPQDVLSKRVAIVGSRDYKDLDAVKRYVYSLPRDVTVISGGARGVDTVAVETAKERGMRTVVIPVNQRGLPEDGVERNSLFAQRAMIRNGEIVQVSGSVAAFWDEKSPGTKNTIERAEKAGIPVIINPSVEKASTQLRLVGFGGAAYDEIALIERGKVSHGLPEEKKEEPPFEWSAPWLGQKDDVWVWDGWENGKRTFKLVPIDSNEAKRQARFLQGYFYNSNTQELRAWLASKSWKPTPGKVYDIGDMSSSYELRTGAVVEEVPIEHIALTQQSFNLAVFRNYHDSNSLVDAHGQLAYGVRFSDAPTVYVLDGTHRVLSMRRRKASTMRMEVNTFPETFAQACRVLVLDDDEEAKMEFYADVLREAIAIVNKTKEMETDLVTA